MTKPGLAFCIAATVSTVLAIALAQLDRAAAPPACQADAERLCQHSLEGGPFTVMACLAANKEKLSPQCRKATAPHT